MASQQTRAVDYIHLPDWSTPMFRTLVVAATIAVLVAGVVGARGQQPTTTKPANAITYDEFMRLPVQQRQEQFSRMGADSKALMVRTHAERWVAANRTQLGSSELGALQEAIAFITPRIYEAPMDPQALKRESDVKASMRCRVNTDDAMAAFSVFNASPVPQGRSRWSYLSQAKCWIGWFAESVVDYIPTPHK
jgi:hypothetical protein